MIINSLYVSNLPQAIMSGFILFIISCIFYFFSPFGIGFIIASFIRSLSKNMKTKKICFVFQIILAIICFTIGLIISLILFASQNTGYSYQYSWVYAISVILAVCLMFVIEVGIIIWQSIKN